jgi:endonuclease/exonuclease/phosphatase family metal-dependent hydrolase
MRLQVASYNVRSFRAGVDGAVEAVGSQTHLVLVQESGSRRAVRRYATALGLQSVSSHRVFGRVRNAVLHPPHWRVVDTEVVTLSRRGRTLPRGFVAVRFRADEVQITAVSAHLGLSPREREAHAHELTDWIGGQHGAFVLGIDVNDGPEDAAARWIGERLYDAFAVAGEGSGSTFPALVPTNRIDYLFAGQGVRVMRCWVAGSDAAARASDHRPIMADLEVPER